MNHAHDELLDCIYIYMHVTVGMCGKGMLSESAMNSLVALHHLEIIYTCVGMVFVVIMGMRVAALWHHEKLFVPTMVLWLIVSWFMVGSANDEPHTPYFLYTAHSLTGTSY